MVPVPVFPGSQVPKMVGVPVFPGSQVLKIDCFRVFPGSQVMRMSCFPVILFLVTYSLSDHTILDIFSDLS